MSRSDCLSRRAVLRSAAGAVAALIVAPFITSADRNAAADDDSLVVWAGSKTASPIDDFRALRDRTMNDCGYRRPTDVRLSHPNRRDRVTATVGEIESLYRELATTNVMDGISMRGFTLRLLSRRSAASRG